MQLAATKATDESLYGCHGLDLGSTSVSHTLISKLDTCH